MQVLNEFSSEFRSPAGKVLYVLNMRSPAAAAALAMGKTIWDPEAANLDLD